MATDTVSVLDAELSVISAGEGGAPLLLVHGFTGCKEDFADEVDHLAALGYHAVSPDLRGHGDSHHPGDEADYSLQHFADELFALVDALGWEQFDLLGHSMGGMIVQVMALQRPERIHRLILMDTHHGVIPGIDLDLVDLGVQLARTEGLEVIQQILQAGSDPLQNEAYERVCRERPGYREFAEGKMLRSSPVMYAAMLGQMARADDRLEDLRSLPHETLVIVGEHDAPFLDGSEAMAAAIATAEHYVLAEGGHSPQFEATDAWRKVVHGFLGEAAPR